VGPYRQACWNHAFLTFPYSIANFSYSSVHVFFGFPLYRLNILLPVNLSSDHSVLKNTITSSLLGLLCKVIKVLAVIRVVLSSDMTAKEFRRPYARQFLPTHCQYLNTYWGHNSDPIIEHAITVKKGPQLQPT